MQSFSNVNNEIKSTIVDTKTFVTREENTKTRRKDILKVDRDYVE